MSALDLGVQTLSFDADCGHNFVGAKSLIFRYCRFVAASCQCAIFARPQSVGKEPRGAPMDGLSAFHGWRTGVNVTYLEAEGR